MKKSIGILLRALDLGGAEKQSLLLADLLRPEYEVYFFIQKEKPCLKQHVDFINKKKINSIQLGGNGLKRALQLRKDIKKYNIKVVFAYLTTDNFLAAITSMFCKSKFVGGLRNSYLPKFKLLVTKIAHNHFLNFMILNNHSGMDYFVKNGFLSKKMQVIHNCIDIVNENIIRKPNGVVKILSVGRFTAQKDYKTALLAINCLLNNYAVDVKIEYTIVGDGELNDQIKLWAKELNIPSLEIVTLPDNLNEYYLKSDIYLLTSLFEGLPNTIMEAVNYSLPVVATDVGDAKYLVKQGHNGYLAPAGKYEEIASYLFELVNDPSKRKDFGRNGNELIAKEFSPEKFKSKYLSFVEKLI